MTKPAAYGDVAAVAAHLGVSERTVRRMLGRGLRHYKMTDSQQGGVRIKWSDLDTWLSERAVEAD